MPPADFLPSPSPFPSPSTPFSSSLQLQGSQKYTHGREMQRDHILNMSPIPPNHLDSAAHLGKTSLPNTSNNSGSDALALALIPSPTSKSSDELVNEITTLEVEILRLESRLLSLYRTAFQPYLPRFMDEPSPGDSSKHPSNHGPSDLVLAIQNSSSGKEMQKAYSLHRSLAEHLGSSRIDDSMICPARLSEDIMRCISSIYCKLANPMSTGKSRSVSSTSSYYSSSTFSPRNFSGSWSPQYTEEVPPSCDFKSLQQENGPYAAMVEVLKISADDKSYNYAAVMLQRFRSLVNSLKVVDTKKMRREEKLAFWINIHNALVMHAYLAYGTRQYLKSNSIVKASYNVGGHCINAYDIQNSILGIKSHYSAPWRKTLLSPGKKMIGGSSKHALAIDYPEPLVHFALSSGAYSDPAVRVYRADNIFEDLKVAKEEFIQATVYVHKETKIYLSKILSYYAKDMSLGMGALLDMVSGCLSGTRKKSMRACSAKGKPEKYVHWLEQGSAFRYLIHKEIAETRWDA